jgi:hypothetical protein
LDSFQESTNDDNFNGTTLNARADSDDDVEMATISELHK